MDYDIIECRQVHQDELKSVATSSTRLPSVMESQAQSSGCKL